MLREFRELSFWKHHTITAVVAFGLLTLSRTTGVFGGDTFWTLTLRSAVHIAVAYPIFTVGAHLAMTGLPNNIPLVFRALVGCLIVIPLIALISPVAAWSLGVMPAHIYQGPTRADLYEAIRIGYWDIVVGYATLGIGVWLFLNFEWWRLQLGTDLPLRQPEPQAVHKRTHSPIKDAAPAGVFAGPAFIKRLSPEKRGELWALTAEQHYLRVYTNRGDDLILMRFSDAIAELEHADGLQIHRSHWVARIGVKHMDEDGSRIFVILKNDIRIPVSRPNSAAAKLAFESSCAPAEGAVMQEIEAETVSDSSA